MSKIMHYNHLTHTMEWYDGSNVPAEIFQSLFDENDTMHVLSFFYLQDLRKQRLQDRQSSA